MMCEFVPEQPVDCSIYALRVEFWPKDPQLKRGYECPLKNSTDKECGCSIEIAKGFLLAEDSTVTLRRVDNGTELKRTVISTEGTIKPKTPTMTNVTLTRAGQTTVIWRTNYEDSKVVQPGFTEKLVTEIYFKEKNAKEWDTSIVKAMHKTHLDMLLEPNTEYIFKARVYHSEYLKYSDWSEEFQYATLDSGEDVSKKVIPVLVVILVFIVCTLACCYAKIKKEWWSKISSTPKIGPIDHLKSQEKMFLNPEKTTTSSLMVDIFKTDIMEEEKSIAVSSVGGSSGHFSNAESSKTSLGDYGRVTSLHEEDLKDAQLFPERVSLAFQHDMEQARRIRLDQVPGLALKCQSVGISQGSESERGSSPTYDQSSSSGSSFNNRCYSPLVPNHGQSSFFTMSSGSGSDHGYQSDGSGGVSPVSLTADHVTPFVQTDFDYRSCDGCLIGKVEPISQFTGVSPLQLVSSSGEADERLMKMGGQGQALSTCVDMLEKGKEWGMEQFPPCLPQQTGAILVEDDYRPF
ncbi:uncharacterized protein LOC134436021 isoform X2 [Engraulis encrasicolus]